MGKTQLLKILQYSNVTGPVVNLVVGKKKTPLLYGSIVSGDFD